MTTPPTLAFAFVTYHPQANLRARIQLLSERGCSIYLFDNSPDCENNAEDTKALDGVKYFTAGKNVGLGFPLTLLPATAYADGWDRLLFLDQDTGISAQTLDFISDFNTRQADLADKGYSVVTFDGKSMATATEIIDAKFTINSGSLFILENLKKLNWHNESYFVECLDYEFCLRSIIEGFRIGKVYNTPGFDHSSEQPDRIVTLMGRALPVRRYRFARVKDAFYAYLKLMGYCLRQRQIMLFGSTARSLLIYGLGQTLARVTRA